MAGYCPKCTGYGYSKFCTQCGVKRALAKLCNWCWHETSPNDSFCGRCGRSISEALNTRPRFLVSLKALFFPRWGCNQSSS